MDIQYKKRVREMNSKGFKENANSTVVRVTVQSDMLEINREIPLHSEIENHYYTITRSYERSKHRRFLGESVVGGEAGLPGWPVGYFLQDHFFEWGG